MNQEAQRQVLGFEIEKAIRFLHLVAVDARLYLDTHPRFQETLTSAMEFLTPLLERNGEIELKQVEGRLIHGNVPLQNRIHSTEDFCRELKRREIECLVLKKGLTRKELVEYAHYFRLSDSHRRKLGKPADHFRNRGVIHIETYELADMRHGGTARESDAKGLPIAMTTLSAFRKEKFLAVKELQRKVEVAQVLDLDVAENIVHGFLRESAANSSVLIGLSSITSVDQYTASHSMNVCLLSVCMARSLGVDGPLLHQMGISCLLHDIGKMFVPGEILNKKGQLDPEEWKIMQSHPALGARFLLSINGLPPLAPIVAYEHHMAENENGYPPVPSGYAINMASKMASVADFYDALTTDRPYRKAMPPAKAIQIMHKLDRTKMDPRLRRLFLEMLGPHPVGSVVRLQSGEVAVVSQRNPESPDLPRVQVVKEPGGKHLEENIPVDLAAAHQGGDESRVIVEPLDPVQEEIDPLSILEKIAESNAGAESPPAQSETSGTPVFPPPSSLPG